MANDAPDPRHALGRSGEAAAEGFLARQGMRVVARRFRVRGGEIDLVAEDGDTLVFVEVKTRRGGDFGRPAEAVDAIKRRRLVRAARAYLLTRARGTETCRFDVVEVLVGRDGTFRVTLLRDAFVAP